MVGQKEDDVPVIVAPRLLVDGELIGPRAVVVENGCVVDVVPVDAVHEGSPGLQVLPDGLLTAGLVDVQVNGFAGSDLVAASSAEWREVRHRLARTGVTSFLGTYITAPVEDLAKGLLRAVEVMAQDDADGARLLGIHVEGPFLSPAHHGAHNAALMVDPTDDRLDVLLDGPGASALRILTLAPERDHALDAIRRLTGAGVVVSIGHTDARATQVTAAADAGATMVTHLFNAQRPLGHREPGVPGQSLVDPRLTLGLIVDLVHNAPTIVALAFAAAGGRVALVTDAIAAAGMPSGRYELGGEAVLVSEGDVPRRQDGTIAGSSLTLDTAVRNAVSCGVAVATALDAATRVPARVLGRQDIGRVAPGTAADLVWWSDDLQVRRVWRKGHPLG